MLNTLMLLFTTVSPAVACPAPGAPIHHADVQDASLNEISGITASRLTPGVMWAHQDSGDGAQIYALDGSGAHLATFTVTGASAEDWEDMASTVEDDGVAWLYVADVGDNSHSRSEVTVWRFPEPVVDLAAPADGATAMAERIDLTWPLWPRNSETLLVDVANDEIVLVSKEGGGVSDVMVAPATAGAHVLQPVGILQFGVPPLDGHVQTTGGAVAPDGTGAVIRTYDSAFYWPVVPGDSVADAIVFGQPCEVTMPGEQQGEAIMFNRLSDTLGATSEGTNQPLWKIPLQ